MFLLGQFFAEVMVVEAGIGGTGQLQDALPHALGQAAVAGPSAAGVCQSGCAALPITSFEALDMPRRKVEQLRRSGTRQVSLNAR